MKKKVKILLYPDEHKSKNGAFFEDLIRSILDKEGYEITQNINFTGLEIDLLAKHKTRNETLIVECKAKEKPKSTELKNFAYNVLIEKKGDYGYFIYTEELNHQAAGLAEQWKNEPSHKNITLIGPDKIIKILVDSNKIKNIDTSLIPDKENIDIVILAYTYFGIYYIVIPYEGTKKNYFYVINAETGKPIKDIKKIAKQEISDTLTIENALKQGIKEISNLQFVNLEALKDNSIPIIHKYTCDYPLELTDWVGREQELKNISLKNFNVIFITGIGGQGKSALASYYIQNIVPQDDYWEYWDWRDLKEEGNRLHTKIISIIERLTNGEIKPSNIKDEPLETLLKIFFQHLSDRRIVFVFDNVDKYIDLEDFTLTGGLNILYSYIKKSHHKSKFIFTCRPSVLIADVNVYQIKLSGITENDTIELFIKSEISIKEEELIKIAKEVHNITKGHPHWIKLFIGQAYSGKDKLYRFIDTVKDKTNFREDNLAAIFSTNILDTIWQTLNSNQRTLLRSLAETVKAETEENIGKIINPELSYNRFHKAMKRLKRLNLIVIKSLKDEQDQLELHPLVKEFVLQKYPLQNERSKFITLFVDFYNNKICVLRERLNWDMPFNDFEQWTSKIELEVNNHDFKSALITLKEVEEPLLTAGYLMEFIRVSKHIFSKIDWNIAIREEYSYFISLLKTFISTLTELGETVKANDLLTKFSNTIQGKGDNYISYCDVSCYHYWFIGNFDNAIKWGERIIELKKNENGKNIINSLALAWRDSKKPENLKKALEYFLEGEKLDDVINPNIIKKELSGPFYGNIGRCLFFDKQYDDALICYKKSYKLLAEKKVSNTDINIGYALLWIGEVLIEKQDNNTAIKFLLGAVNIWQKISPPKANKTQELIDELIEKDDSLKNEYSEEEIKNFCNDWINN